MVVWILMQDIVSTPAKSNVLVYERFTINDIIMVSPTGIRVLIYKFQNILSFVSNPSFHI